ITLERNKASLLADAMDQVNSRAIALGLNASAAPNLSTTASNLKTALQSTQNLQANAAASSGAVSRALAAPKGAPPPPNPLDDPPVKALITLQSDLSACVLKAG